MVGFRHWCKERERVELQMCWTSYKAGPVFPCPVCRVKTLTVCRAGRPQELIEGRQRLVKEFTEYRDRCIELWRQQKPQRLELRDGQLGRPAVSPPVCHQL